MRMRISIVAATLLALALPSFAGGAVKGMWEGCKEGSWVLNKTTTKGSMTGGEAPDTVSEMRQTLVKVTDEAWTVKMEMKVGDTWGEPMEVPYPRIAAKAAVDAKDAPKPEELGTEKVKVDGKDYDCKKTKQTEGKTSTISWVNEAEGLLKSETTGELTMSMLVTTLAKKAKIGEKEVTCRETKILSKLAGFDSTLVQLTSDDVPTRVVRQEMTLPLPAKSSTVQEMTGFEIK